MSNILYSALFLSGLSLMSWVLRSTGWAHGFRSMFCYSVSKYIKGHYPVVGSVLVKGEYKPIRGVALSLFLCISVCVAVFVGLSCGWLGGIALFYLLFSMLVCSSYVLYVCLLAVTGFVVVGVVSWVLASGFLVVTTVVILVVHRKDIRGSYFWGQLFGDKGDLSSEVAVVVVEDVSSNDVGGLSYVRWEEGGLESYWKKVESGIESGFQKDSTKYWGGHSGSEVARKEALGSDSGYFSEEELVQVRMRA